MIKQSLQERAEELRKVLNNKAHLGCCNGTFCEERCMSETHFNNAETAIAKVLTEVRNEALEEGYEKGYEEGKKASNN